MRVAEPAAFDVKATLAFASFNWDMDLGQQGGPRHARARSPAPSGRGRGHSVWAKADLARMFGTWIEGTIVGLDGLSADVRGLGGLMSVGDRLQMISTGGSAVAGEIVAFRDGAAKVMAFGPLDGLGPGSKAVATIPPRAGGLAVSDAWLGRVLDPLGRPLDGRGPLPSGDTPCPLRGAPPDAGLRGRLGPRIDLGVRALDVFTSSRRGQRLGLFAGSGVGKSTLLSMLARHADCDVAVLALVGERGREVREFIEDDLGAEGLRRTCVVVATADAAPLLRREAAYAAMTIAEHFRDQGKSVLLMMDSVTRFCHALREIGLSAGQPPATRGYPPGVFADLPKLLERAGPGVSPGSAPRPDGVGYITGLFTVLVEGDDMNEPVADAVRGILDGHVVLDRRIGESGRYPAIDVLRSLSRAVPGCNSDAENALTVKARAILALHADTADLVRLGAYKRGTDKAVDEAIELAPRIEAILRQAKDDRSDVATGFARLAAALNLADPG